jgi:hypothetical protein
MSSLRHGQIARADGSVSFQYVKYWVTITSDETVELAVDEP